MSGPYLHPSTVRGHRWVLSDRPGAIKAVDRQVDEDEIADDVSLAADIGSVADLLLSHHPALLDTEGRTRVRTACNRHGAELSRDRGPVGIVEALTPFADEVRGILADAHFRFVRARAVPAGTVRDTPIEWEQSGPSTAVVTVRRLWGQGDELRALDQLARWSPPADCEHLVFDLRGCPGGDDSYTSKWIERHITTSVAVGSQMTFDGAARAIDEWNLAQYSMHLTGRPLPPGMLRVLEPGEHVVRALDRLGEAGERAPRSLHEEHRTLKPAVDTRPYTGRVTVLVDRGTGSSAESTTIMLREAFGATIVGERTRGMIDFGNTVPFPTPATGIVWDVATHHNCYPGGRVDVVGIPVDIPLTAADLRRPAAEIVATLSLR